MVYVMEARYAVSVLYAELLTLTLSSLTLNAKAGRSLVSSWMTSETLLPVRERKVGSKLAGIVADRKIKGTPPGGRRYL